MQPASGPRPRRRAAAIAAGLLAVATAAATGAGWSRPAPAAAATTISSITVTGHGDGHGVGMGQWGAYGYALSGWTSQQILAHYYGGTTLASVPERNLTVVLTELAGAPTVVTGVSGGALAVTWPGGTAHRAAAVRVTHANGTQTVSGGPGCSGPWTVLGTTTAAVTVASAVGTGATLAAPGTSETSVCLPSGPRIYQGRIVATPAGATDNIVPLEDYVDGVVPREMPASWSPAALEAQAVAARSYALAYQIAYGQVCDSTSCQVYGGLPDQWGENADSAVKTTAGQVLECTSGSACGPAGSVAVTEYSASTGGYTAGGPYPAVPDAGDAVAGNSMHDWSATLSAAAVESAFPSVGTLEAVTVTARNGLGDLGGRVESITVGGTGGTLSLSGGQFAGALGLPSDWFAVTATSAPSGPAGNYWLADRAGGVFAGGTAPADGGAAGTVLAGSTVALAPTPDGGGYWLAGAGGGVLAFGDAAWHGSASHLALPAPVVGMAATPDGKGYWLLTSAGNLYNYGDAGWWGSLYGVHRSLPGPPKAVVATPDGKGYWLVTSAGNVFNFGDARWFGSPRASRITLLSAVVAAARTPDGGGYWLFTAAGGVWPYGDARSFGGPYSTGEHLPAPVVAATAAPDGSGYSLLLANGALSGWGSLRAMSGGAPAGWSGPGVAVALQP